MVIVLDLHRKRVIRELNDRVRRGQSGVIYCQVLESRHDRWKGYIVLDRRIMRRWYSNIKQGIAILIMTPGTVLSMLVESTSVGGAGEVSHWLRSRLDWLSAIMPMLSWAGVVD